MNGKKGLPAFEAAIVSTAIIFFCGAGARAADTPVVQIISPAGGELFFSGQQQTVNITASSATLSLSINLSADGGATWPVVIASGLDNKGKNKRANRAAAFTVPAVNSNQCVIEVIAATAKGPITVASGQFSIGNPPLGAGAITAALLADGSVINSKLAALAVTKDKISSLANGAAAAANCVLAADGNTYTSWKDPNTLGISASGAAGGDLAGSYPNPTLNPNATPAISALTIANNLAVGGNATISGTLSAGAATLTSLSVSGVTEAAGGLTVIGGDLVVGSPEKFRVSEATGNTTIAGKLDVAGAINANGGISTSSGPLNLGAFNNTTSVAGALAVSGATTISSLSVTGTAAVIGGLALGNATTAGSLALSQANGASTTLAPGASGNLTFTLPPNVVADYLLTTDASGNLRWVPPPAGTLPATGNQGATLYLNGGNWTVNNSVTADGGGNITAIGKAALRPASDIISPNYGLLSLGAGPFDGVTTGFFAGHTYGTVAAINAGDGFMGNLIDAQVSGTSNFSVDYLGRVSASGGAFTVGTMGNINVAQGNCYVDAGGNITANGSLSAAGGNFLVDTSGNTTVKGAANLSGGLVLNRTAVNSSSYTVLPTDSLIGVNFAGTATITLPAPVAGSVFIIKDESGHASDNNIAISGNGANIDGQANKQIDNNYGVLRVYSDGANYFTF